MAKKTETKVMEPTVTVEALQEKIAFMRKAQEEFASYSQEQVDKIFFHAAMAANKQRIPLARMACEETGMGVLEDKVIKNHFAAEYTYNAYKRAKTCGIVEVDTAYGTKRVAEPVGIIGAVIPTTNPTSTAIFKCLICLKTRNAIIISPHPRARQSTIAAAKIVLEAAVKAGAPKGIIDWIEEPSIELSNALMKSVDVILATGGPGMVNAAYSSGKPAIGVGPGNAPVIMDDTCDIKTAVYSVIHSKTFDNGMICASEQSVTALESIYDDVKKEFIARGCYVLKKDEMEKVGQILLTEAGTVDPKIVGQPAHKIAAMAGLTVPEETKILIGEAKSVEPSEPFAHEKLSPVLALYKAKDFDTALDMADKLVRDGGFGHTASLYVNTLEKEKLDKFAHRMKTCRVLVNTPSSQGGIGDLYNFKLAPSLTLGCGSYGGNSVSENVGIKHLLNLKTVAERRENMLWFRTPQKVYFKKGCLPVALNELKHVYDKKKAFIITDTFLFTNGYTKPITDHLDEIGIRYECFFEVTPDPTIQCARKGIEALRAFEPDTIIALGGGSAMDAAKIMWMMYEHPECDFEDLAMDFMDIRKRVYTFPKMGEKAMMVSIPTSSGTGSEVTPFAIITDADTRAKWPITDYELLPNMAIIDADNMMDQPKGLTSSSGIDALTHALEAYASIMATDFTDGMALQATKLIFDYLPTAYEKGAGDPHARERMGNASTLAGMAFANAFLGICHSMAHKLGAYHHLPHGISNALLIEHVMRYNANPAPKKMGTFPQYPYPKAKARYCEMARFVGITGKDEDEIFENFIKAIADLKEKVGIKRTIKEYGIEEKDFMKTLDEMVENAFNDQCTSSNPRYPLMSEMKEMYLKAFHEG